jgi:hypothetical protein
MVHRYRGLGIGPGAEKQQQQSVMEDVGKPGQCRVVVLALSLADVLRQVGRQRSIGTIQTEVPNHQPLRLAGNGWQHLCNGGRGKGERRVLAQAYRLRLRARSTAQSR